MEPKHTLLGIASFVLSVLTGACAFGLFVIAVIVHGLSHGDYHPRRAAEIIFGLCLLALFSTNLVALGLGIAGLAQSDRKKLFAMLGTAFAAVQILGTILLAIASAHHAL